MNLRSDIRTLQFTQRRAPLGAEVRLVGDEVLKPDAAMTAAVGVSALILNRRQRTRAVHRPA